MFCYGYVLFEYYIITCTCWDLEHPDKIVYREEILSIKGHLPRMCVFYSTDMC